MSFVINFLASVGRSILGMSQFVGSIAILSFRTCIRMMVPPYPIKDIISQMDLLGVRSLRIALLTAAAAGAVLTLQFGYGLQKFGAKEYVGPVVAISLLRELAPVLTALIVGGRIGSGMAAELGSMKVGEQIDAIRALGADPIRKLIVPRLAASLLVIPLLTVMANMLGLLASALLASSQFDVGYLFFYQSVLDNLVMSDLMSGLLKSVVFGFLVAMIGCYMGFSTKGGTQGVGLSTTGTVELISISVLVSDFFLTKFLMMVL